MGNRKCLSNSIDNTDPNNVEGTSSCKTDQLGDGFEAEVVDIQYIKE
jgi:hypothetical protein